MKKTCENCKHSYKLPSYNEEHSLGLLFCRKVKYINEAMKIEPRKMHVFYGENGEGVGNNVMDYVHEDYGCINFKKRKK